MADPDLGESAISLMKMIQWNLKTLRNTYIPFIVGGQEEAPPYDDSPNLHLENTLKPWSTKLLLMVQRGLLNVFKSNRRLSGLLYCLTIRGGHGPSKVRRRVVNYAKDPP